jgi:hypothetical protein|tara:strand:- start:502 stop:642 length:141 start_codon:yes stop_codon:yes gene_type:complete
MKFSIKDFNYLGIILILLIAFLGLHVQHQKEYQWCEYFYDKYGRDM